MSTHKQVGVDREQGAPTKTRKRDPARVHLARSVVEQLAKELEDDQTNNAKQDIGDDRETLEDEVRQVEGAGGGDIVGQKRRGTGRVVFDGLDDSSSRCTQSGDQEDLDDLESEVVVLHS